MTQLSEHKDTADALANYYREKFAQDTGRKAEEYSGLWVTWDQDDQSYELRGEGLPAHPDLTGQHPNGWSLIDHVSPEKAANLLDSDRASWIAWLESYGAGKLFDSIMLNCQGAESTCQYCGESIYFDITEGGGVPDWGSAYPGSIGLDYGCGDSPDTGDEGTGGHMPRKRA